MVLALFLYADHGAGTVPALIENFFGVHSDVLKNDTSNLDCFQLFMSDEVVESLCLRKNVREAKFLMDNPTLIPNNFMRKKWRDVTKDEMNVFLCLLTDESTSCLRYQTVREI